MTAPARTRPRVVLFGPPGALVDQVATALAARLGVPALDTDALVEQRTGKHVADVLIQDGEQAFRDVEREAAADALARDGVVVALGGGAPLDPRTAGLLTDHARHGTCVVELGVSVSTASKRLRLSLGVPSPIINARAQWLAQQKLREPHYAKVRTHLVPTDYLEPDRIAEQIIDLVRRSAGDWSI